MKAYSLTQLLNVVPCDFDVKIIGNCGVDTAYVVRVDYKRKTVTIGGGIMENTSIETVETKPKRKHLLAEIAQLKELNKKLKGELEYSNMRVDSRERNIAELKAEIAALRAYVAGVKGDAFPESEDK